MNKYYLELNYINGEEEDNYTDEERQRVKSYSTNFSTHINIKSIKLSLSTTSPYDLKDLKLDKMVQLEELVIRCFLNIDIEPILMLPNLKKITFSFFDKETTNSIKDLIKNSSLRFPSVEEITMF